MIAITASTGHLGRLVIEELLKRVPAGQVIALARDPDKAKDLAKRGVSVRKGDYDAPATLASALDGAQRVLFISGSEVGRRVPQHTAVVEAALKARVSLLAYTSILSADTSGMMLAGEHKATEALIRASGLPFVLLRDGWYVENYTEHLAPALEHGVFLGAAGDGRIAAAPRADYAAAAAAVLTSEGHAGKVYELAGDTAFTMSELAAEVSRWSGRSVGYKNLPAEEYAQALMQAGLPEPVARVFADCDVGVARGELNTTTGDLRRLIGRATTPLSAVLARLPRP